MNAIVYHATSDDDSFGVITSFRNGIKSNLAHGYGQGSGFYVWTTKQGALNHIESGFINKRYPVIVSIQADINPNEWDIDHEANYASSASFLKNNLKLLQEIIKNKSVQIDGIFLTNAGYNQFIGKDGKDYSSIGLEWSNGSTQGIGVGKDTFEESASIQDAKIIGVIINTIQSKYPSIVNDWEQRVFDYFINNGQNTAIKYIGQNTIYPSIMEIYINNQWINVTNQNPNIPNNNGQPLEQGQLEKQYLPKSGFITNYIGKISEIGKKY